MSDLRQQHQQWLFEQQNKPEIKNPCVRIYGADPEGRTCKSCVNLYSRHFAKVYHKCKLRKETRGAGSDHRVNWPACAKYEAEAQL